MPSHDHDDLTDPEKPRPGAVEGTDHPMDPAQPGEPVVTPDPMGATEPVDAETSAAVGDPALDADPADTPDHAAAMDQADTPDPADPAGAPAGEALLASGSSDDPEAPDVHPGAADPGASASSSGRRDLAVVGIVVLLILAGVAAFVLLRGGGDPAYTVYDEQVSVPELQQQLEGLVDPELVTVAANITEATPEQHSVLAQAMSSVITQEVMIHAAEQRGIEVTVEDVDAQLEEVIEAGFGGDREAFESQIESAGLSEEAVRAQFRTALLAEELAGDNVADVEDAAVQEAYDQQFTEPLVSHILTETREEAEAARQRVEDGEEFGAVAAEVSIDPGSGAQGGQLGPLREGQFVPEFEEAAQALEPGELSEVVETEFGFHVITIEEPPAFDEVSDMIRQSLEDQNLNEGLAELAAQLDEEANVTVDSDYGTWAGLAQGLVVPQADLPLPEGQAPPGAPGGQPPAEGQVPAGDQPAGDEPAGDAPADEVPADGQATEAG